MSSIWETCRQASGPAQGLHVDRKPSPHLNVAWSPEALHSCQIYNTSRRLQKSWSLVERRARCRTLEKGLHSGIGKRSGHGGVCCSSRKSSDQVVEAPEKDLTGGNPIKEVDEKAGQVLAVNQSDRIDETDQRSLGTSGGRVSGTDNESALSPASTSGSNGWREASSETALFSSLREIGETLLLISPFFFWGTAMVAMKEVLPKAGPLFVAATRLLPAGGMLIGFTMLKGKSNPSTAMAWLAVALFALVDGTMFQGFLAQGLSRTSAGLGSVIIDSQPLTVALLAALLFGETIGPLGALGLATGVLGLCLLEVPEDTLFSLLRFEWLSAPSEVSQSLSSLNPGGLWESGEWWMLLAAQSMAVGTVMVRWVSKYVDPVVATGWHMLLGGIPLLLLSVSAHEPAVSGHFSDLDSHDFLALLYTSVFGCAVSYGVFFYNASRGNLTKLSSLTFLTPMFAAFFGYLYLDETLTQIQLGGAAVTLVGIYLVNFRSLADSLASTKDEL